MRNEHQHKKLLINVMIKKVLVKMELMTIIRVGHFVLKQNLKSGESWFQQETFEQEKLFLKNILLCGAQITNQPQFA